MQRLPSQAFYILESEPNSALFKFPLTHRERERERDRFASDIVYGFFSLNLSLCYYNCSLLKEVAENYLFDAFFCLLQKTPIILSV